MSRAELTAQEQLERLASAATPPFTDQELAYITGVMKREQSRLDALTAGEAQVSADSSAKRHRAKAGQRWYTAGDVALILTTVMERQGPQDSDFRVYPLSEVAELTLFSLDTLEKLCRRNEVEHVKSGRSRGMTGRQIGLLIERYSQGVAALADLRSPETSYEEIQRNIRKNVARGRRRATDVAELAQARELSRTSARRSGWKPPS